MQALLDNVTTPELRGNIIVILGGYAEHVEELFSVNPGDHSPTHYPPLTTHLPHPLTYLTHSLPTHCVDAGLRSRFDKKVCTYV